MSGSKTVFLGSGSRCLGIGCKGVTIAVVVVVVAVVVFVMDCFFNRCRVAAVARTSSQVKFGTNEQTPLSRAYGSS